MLSRRRAVLVAAAVASLTLASAAAALQADGDAADALPPVKVRAVEDVAPALRNATSSAFVGAQKVLDSYSDLLVGIAVRTLNPCRGMYLSLEGFGGSI
jgi:hypothetical protein